MSVMGVFQGSGEEVMCVCGRLGSSFFPVFRKKLCQCAHYTDNMHMTVFIMP